MRAPLALAAIVSLVSIGATADSDLAEKKTSYIGDYEARYVCASVVDDDPDKLQQLLKRYRRSLLHGFRFDLTSHAVAGSFSCNRLALLPFADKIGANNVSTYLRGGVVTIEELVSSTN